MMLDFLLYVVVVALFSAFGLTLLRKWGAIEYVQVHGSDFFAEMFNCDFCLSWWAGVVVSIVWAIFVGDAVLLLVPFFSTKLTQKLL